MCQSFPSQVTLQVPLLTLFGAFCMELPHDIFTTMYLCLSMYSDGIAYYALDEDKVCLSFAELLLKPADKVSQYSN